VVIESAQGKILGKALRIDRRGALVIRDDRGGEREILVGDVSLRLSG
jgi:biotin-(acetyl-CoA carboxylase) ligase